MEIEAKKIKVLYIITKSNWGGAQRHVFDLATSLPKDKYEVIVAGGGDGPLLHKLEDKNITVLGLQNLGRDIKVSKELLSFLGIYRIIRKTRPNILHLHSPKAGALGALAGRISNIFNRLSTFRSPLKTKIIYTSHGWPFNEPRSFFQKIFIKFFSWITIILCSKVIVLSEIEKKQVFGWPMTRKKLEIIPNGIENINLVPKDEARKTLERLVGLPLENAFIVGSIAELHRNKGLDFAIKGLPETPNIHYVIFGDGEERKKLLNDITHLGLGKRIHLLGHNNKASELLLGFDAFILPSLKEGLPYGILEAGFAGIPVIASRVGGIPDLIDHFKDGFLITPGRPSEIKNSLTYLLDHQKEAESMAKLFNKKIKLNYTLEGEMLKICSLYCE